MDEQVFNATTDTEGHFEGTASAGLADSGPRRAKIGDIVGYVLEQNSGGNAIVRPAIVVLNWSDPPHEGTLQLQVFMDGDGGPYNDHLPNVCWRTSVVYDEDKAVGTWHWL